MNRILLFMLTSLICIIDLSCDEDNTQSVEVLPVSNITFEQKPGGILFRWDNPNTECSYVEILFKNDPTQENPQRIIVQSPLTEQLISGLPDAEEREFTFSAFQNGKVSAPVTLIAQGQQPPINRLANAIQASVVPNGKKISVSWDNLFEGEYVISMFIDKIKDKADREIVIHSPGKDGQLIYMPEDLFSANVIFTLRDAYGNERPLFEKSYLSISESGWLDRGLWTIANISSEHAGWLATNILDGKSGTSWASYLVASNDFPHYLIFDLQRNVRLSKARIMPGNAHSKMFIRIQGSTSPNKNSQWTDIATYSVPNTTTGVWQEIEFPAEVTYRYIRFYCERSLSNDYYAVMAEFALYGQDIVD